MQRKLCVMSEAKCSITEAKCLQISHSKYAFQRNATTSNCRIMAKSHPAGMQICYTIFAGISLRLCSISLRSFRITFAAYLPTHIKSLRDFFFSLRINNSSLISYQKWVLNVRFWGIITMLNETQHDFHLIFMKIYYICNMANTYYQLYYHVVFAVSSREATIMESWREELYKYITGAIRNQKCELIAIGGMADHVHLLVQIPPKISISSFVQSIKIQSTNWINEKHFCKGKFGWQEGYGVFTASRSHVPQIKNYIFNQKSHHKQKAFLEEYITMLEGYGVEYNKDYIFKSL